ncbi:ABC transporter permease [Rhodovulum sp. DZ06]|uniref:ABC transporter permease n=1 Tax=Rhodovulum sp. DZ06 TaxID=3425126 RepID=UPI003D34D284
MRWSNVLHLGVKELRALARDPVMIGLIVWAFSLAIYAAATSMPDTLHRAPVAVADLDRSGLSQRIVTGLRPPLFTPPQDIAPDAVDKRMDAGIDTFAVSIPPHFQRDVLAGRSPAIAVDVDATRVAQAFAGAGYIEAIAMQETADFLAGHGVEATEPVALALRARFNPGLDQTWFSGVMELINNVTILAIVLTGAALIREREHGTVEHLLAMPVTPAEIMAAKLLAMGAVVLGACALSLTLVCEGLLGVQVAGSIPLFLAGAGLHVFAACAMGILLGTAARSMPQFGLLMMMIVLPLQMLSGGMTPFESMPAELRALMSLTPNTHFVALAQAILFRGAGLDVVWPHFAALAALGAALLGAALARMRASIGEMG